MTRIEKGQSWFGNSCILFNWKQEPPKQNNVGEGQIYYSKLAVLVFIVGVSGGLL
jgi:hypothetical protein